MEERPSSLAQPGVGGSQASQGRQGGERGPQHCPRSGESSGEVTDNLTAVTLTNNFIREKSRSPRTKEEVEEELDETILALEQQVTLNLSRQHPSVATTTGLVTRAAVSVRDAAGAVREVAENILKSLTPERVGQESDEEEMSGYDDDFSVGIALPLAVDTTSGNVTPIPTTGELEELSSVDDQTVTEEISLSSVRPQDSRLTPLKSLLKKPSFEMAEPSSSSDSDSDDGKISPKKVHFSEIDQVDPVFVPI